MIWTREKGLWIGVLAVIGFCLFGSSLLSDLNNAALTVPAFIILFSVMLWCSFGVVRHADCLAIRLGEPYGTLILTLAVISIEVIMISAVMLTGADNPTLGRDMMFSVLMIVLNGLVGVSLLVGGMKHYEQDYNLQGVNTFLAVLIPLAVLGLILPNYTESTATGTFSVAQMVFLFVANIALYGAFLAIQTIRHSDYFQPLAGAVEGGHDHGELEVKSTVYHAILLIAYMLPIIFLSKKLALIVDFSIDSIGAPAALGGLIVAVLVLAPEGLAAIRSAMEDNLQRSINICLGSAVATIGLTIPAILTISLILQKPIILGVSPVDRVLLVLTILVSVVNFASGRSNIIQGLVHIVLFFAYLMMIFD
ncbi:Sodium-potassium/proton antiporter ChaA [BD1-7 clade bacterium]|uniref:Sodium-potassium/proton antiporter ChaA n=1 Tax=BD1-7 clade bacterium TaxID=2029982 RepID=A0A5S9QU40_9GAMM|nr:Sodium-potassium/proton antiporter ChaA [BD1-7 clade bacterium]